MVRTVNVKADIPATRELNLHVVLPADTPLGPADIVLAVSSPELQEASTCGEFLNSEFFGMWRDRGDISDSIEFARELRSEGWKRSA